METHGGEAHPEWVKNGGCPATMPGNPKCWCNGRKNHHGAHWAERKNPPGVPYQHPNHARVYWIGKVIQRCCSLDRRP